MNKRTFLKSIVGKKTKSKATVATAMVNTLTPYTGPWTMSHAVHLLGRTTFGVTKAEIDQAVNEGLEMTLTRLFEEKPLPDPPIYYNFMNDPNAALGETWVNVPPSDVQGLNAGRRRSLAGWIMSQFNNSGFSIKERMILFWHEHMPIGGISRSQFNYDYLNIIWKNALGNFRDLIEEITVCPSMLKYLNGDENTKEAPNENYSRELLELFTIGRGDVAAPGDYTNYTEKDIEELAKSLTGWRAATLDDGTVTGVFRANRHETSTKQLSHRFDNVVIENNDDQEYKDVINIILQKIEVARYLSRQLHIWFVGSDINIDVETNVIEPMAQILYNNNYEIQPAVEALLRSEYFHMTEHRGCMISSPIDFIFKLFNTLELALPEDLYDKYDLWNRLYGYAAGLDMGILAAPAVAGWKAYYQAPQYYQLWINSVTLNLRDVFTSIIVEGINVNGFRLQADLIDFIATLPGALDPNDLINELAEVFFVTPLAQNQKDFLKNVLLAELPDFEWTVEYDDFLQHPDDEQKRAGVENKLKALFGTMLRMPEFYLH